LQSSKLNKDEQNSFYNVFKSYKVKEWVYPGVIKRLTDINISNIYFVLNGLEKEGVLKSYFEIFCECSKTIGEVYESISDIPLQVYCDNCGQEIDSDKHAFLIYRVNTNV
jgi:hypothetical protein